MYSTTVSTAGLASLKYIACLMLVAQQWPEQYGRCTPDSSRCPAHWTKTTLCTSRPSARLIGAPFAAIASASSPAWSTTLGLLPPPNSGNFAIGYDSKPVVWTIAPTSSSWLMPPCSTLTLNRPGAPAVLAIVASRRTLIRGSESTRAAIAATPVSWGSACGAFQGTRFHSLPAQPPSCTSFSTRRTSNPVSAASSAAVMPAMPPPTTRMRRFLPGSGLPAGTFIFFSSAQPIRT